MNSIGGTIYQDDISALPNHYEVLGVKEDASDSEIKSAYFRLVREFRPQENPEEFQRFNEAGQVLSDPNRRSAYDQSRQNGRRMQVLLDQATKAHEKDTQKAIVLLNNAIDFAPNLARPRALLAQVLIRIQDYQSAEAQYQWLIRDNPRDETIRFKLARCLWLQERYAEAEKALHGALKVNARYHDALMLLSRVQEVSDKPFLAAETLERAIRNDGVENYEDLDALLRLFVLYLKKEGEQEAAGVRQRLVSVIPADGSPRTEKALERLLRRADDLCQSEHFYAARCLLDCAAERTDGIEEAAERLKTLSHVVAIRKEARDLQRDKLAEGALKAYLELRYIESNSESLRQKLEVLLARLQGEIELKPHDVISTIDYIHRQFPTIASEQERLLTELRNRAVNRIKANDVWAGNDKKRRSAPTDKSGSVQKLGKKRGLFGWLRGSEK